MARKPPARKAAPKRKAAAKAAPAAKRKAAKAAAEPKRKKPAAKPAARKAKSPARKAAAKKAAPRKAAAAKAPARKTVAKAPARKAAKKAAPKKAAPKKAAPKKPAVSAKRLRTAAPAQRFNVSHLNEADFKRDGLRPYALYRDLGVAAATKGLCQAHVIRFVPPCTDEVRVRHAHHLELQLVYVLKGWVKNEFEGHGVQMMSAGSCFLQPPGIKHTVLDYSADAEVLEIVVPAEFATVETE